MVSFVKNRLAYLMRLLGYGLAGLAIVAVAGCVSLHRGDIGFDDLDARYASADSRFLDLPDGVRLHYRDQGPRDAPALVLVHGFGASLHTWEPWVAELTKDHRVVSLDLPGFGLTRTPGGWRRAPDSHEAAIHALADALALDRFALAGNSMGGRAAWAYALAHPDRLDALILVNAAGWPQEDRGGGTPLIFRLLSNPVGRALLRDLDATSLTRDGLRSAFADDAQVTDAMVRRYTDMSRAPGRRAQILDPSGGMPAPATPEQLATIRTPTLVMVGEVDGVIPAAQSRRFAGAIPGARLIEYPAIGHIPMEEIPAKSAADVRAFLAAQK